MTFFLFSIIVIHIIEGVYMWVHSVDFMFGFLDAFLRNDVPLGVDGHEKVGLNRNSRCNQTNQTHSGQCCNYYAWITVNARPHNLSEELKLRQQSSMCPDRCTAVTVQHMDVFRRPVNTSVEMLSGWNISVHVNTDRDLHLTSIWPQCTNASPMIDWLMSNWPSGWLSKMTLMG